MAFPKLAYEALESILGSEYITDDPAACFSYIRGGEGTGMWDRDRVPPAIVVLPKTTEDVQGIIRVANRYKLPYTPISTRMIAFCAPSRPNTIMIDPKRMDYLEIDAKNQMAIIEPYVPYHNLQAEAFKYGLFTSAPLCGSQASALANTCVFGMGQKVHRIGIGARRLLGAEWVLPNGEIFRLGALAVPGNKPFWGEGPGPDLRGFMRGVMGWTGGMGMVTKIGVKLFAMPYCEPERAGITPFTTLALPEDVIRWYVAIFKDIQTCVEVLYKVGQAEIGLAAMRVPAMWRALRRGMSRNDFWDRFKGELEDIKKNDPNIVRVCLCGFASEKQLEYEERVLQDIGAEHGGNFRRVRPSASGDAFINSIAACAYKATGAFMSQKLGVESIDHCTKQVMNSIHKKFALQDKGILVEDAEEAGWILSYDFGHLCHTEETTYYENDEEGAARAVVHELDTIKYDVVETNSFTGWQLGWNHALFGPHMCNYHELVHKVRDTFDPDWLSHPPRGYISMEEKKKYPEAYPYRPGW